jgi:hypothetical protein
MPMTRTWVTDGMRGVPVGAQIAWLSISKTGCPIASTRVAEVMNCAATHGPLAAGGGGNAQPATTHGPGKVTTGCPLTSTRGIGTVG